MKCKECRDYNLCLHEANVFDQIFDPEYDKAICFKPITNADYIRSMSDEKLAVWLCAFTRCERCVAFDLCKSGGGLACGMKEWLKQPKEKEE